MRHLYDELKRRHVFRVTGFYLVAAYAVVQGAATVFPLLNFPQSAATAVLILAVLGLPVAILLAWVFDITPEGVRRTPDETAVEMPAERVFEQRIEAQRRRLAARAIGFVGVGVLISLVGFAAFDRYTDRGRSSGSGQIGSVAVLPFVDLSPQRDQEYFTDGVTEELLNGLAQLSGLRVAARTSSFAFKAQNIEVGEIGRRLQVDAVLEGSVRRDGDNVRVTARLVDVRTGTQLWSNAYEHKVSTVFALQDEISSQIVDALKLQLAAGQIESVDSPGTRDPQAQDLYYKGLEASNGRTEDRLLAALRYFEQAAAIDTTFAAAYAGLARTYALLPAFSAFPVIDALRNGSAAAARAISLDPANAAAHAALGQIAQNLEWDFPSALRNYRRAVRLNPNDAIAHQWLAEALMLTGDYVAAAAEVERALDLDPLSASAKNTRAYLTLIRGDQAGALRQYQNLAREAPAFRPAQLNYALAAMSAEQWGTAAQALIAAVPQHAPNVGLIIGAASGQADRAAAIAAVQAMDASTPSAVHALFYAAIGAPDRALEKLQSVFAAGTDATFPAVLVHPLLRRHAANAAFRKMIDAVGVALLQN